MRRISRRARRSREGVSKRVFCSKVRGVSRWKPRLGRRDWKAAGSERGNFSSISALCMGEVYGGAGNSGQLGWRDGWWKNGTFRGRLGTDSGGGDFARGRD